MKNFIFGVFLFTMNALLAMNAGAATDPCQSPLIHKVARPFNPNIPSKGNFNYSYEHFRVATGNAPTVIWIPGGPGDTSIDESPETKLNRFSLPETFGLVFTDPRGVGCNRVSRSEPDRTFFSTDNSAKDILAVIKDLKEHTQLKKYILYGGSYGTALATVTAFLAENSADIPSPEAVVLTGVVGRAFRPGELFDGYLEQWAKMKAGLSEDATKMINSGQFPFGLYTRELANIFQFFAVFGTPPENQGFDHVLELETQATHERSQIEPEYLTNLRKWTLQFDSTCQEASAQHLYRQIMCREFTSEPVRPCLDVSFDIRQGELTPLQGHVCDGVALDRPFDVRNYPLKTTLYYLQGDADPSTPPFLAQYHFENEQSANRFYVNVKGGGHCTSVLNDMKSCRVPIFEAIGQGGKGFRDALKKCKDKSVELTVSPARVNR